MAQTPTLAEARISEDGLYRYSLHRAWGDGPMVTWVMLNPSTADATQDDPTIRRCIGFTKSWGYNVMHVVNLYAYRSTDPKRLLEVDDPVGPDNPRLLRAVVGNSALVVAAWGAFAAKVAWERSRLSIESFCHDKGVPLRCLGTTKDGAPRHPLYVKADTPLVPFGVFEPGLTQGGEDG